MERGKAATALQSLLSHPILSEFGVSYASAQCIGYQEAVHKGTLQVYKSSQFVIVPLRVCSGPQL